MSEFTITDTPAPPVKKKSTGKIIGIVAIVLVVCCILAVLIAGIVYLVIQGSGPVKVAILDNVNETDISYWSGGMGNDYDLFRAILTTDPQERFEVSILTLQDIGSLGEYDRLLLPDNALPAVYVSAVGDWLKSGKSIIAIDSAITYVSYAGLMWGVKGENLEDIYWNYDSFSEDLLLVEGPLTRDYFTTAVLSSNSGDAQMWLDLLPEDAVVLAKSTSQPNIAYAACHKESSGGTVFILGPFDSPETDVYELIRAAVYARECK